MVCFRLYPRAHYCTIPQAALLCIHSAQLPNTHASVLVHGVRINTFETPLQCGPSECGDQLKRGENRYSQLHPTLFSADAALIWDRSHVRTADAQKWNLHASTSSLRTEHRQQYCINTQHSRCSAGCSPTARTVQPRSMACAAGELCQIQDLTPKLPDGHKCREGCGRIHGILFVKWKIQTVMVYFTA